MNVVAEQALREMASDVKAMASDMKAIRAQVDEFMSWLRKAGWIVVAVGMLYLVLDWLGIPFWK